MTIGRVGAGVFCIALLLLTSAACDARDSPDSGNPGPARVAELEKQLRAKPSFEATHDEYASAMKQMADEVATLVPGMTWQVETDSWSACSGELAWTRGAQVYHYIVFDKPIPDDVWPRALDVVKAGAARFGATTMQVFVDKPGNRDLALTGADGVAFEFGTKAQTVFSGTSDCRMRAKDADR